ncbi:hypothetical protein [Niabella hibiscisoli]|nr:hypothetical protein [Niabella hibiscisoli]MCH5719230.1 hypothetical protein [Niabella hibiscisoli]
MSGENIIIKNSNDMLTLALPKNRDTQLPYVIVLELNGSAEAVPVIK